jgi:hypothetical protein
MLFVNQRLAAVIIEEFSASAVVDDALFNKTDSENLTSLTSIIRYNRFSACRESVRSGH